MPSGKLSFEALIFDVGGMIIPHDNELLYRRIASRCSAADAVERLRAAAHDPAYGTGALPIRALHARLCRELGYGLEWEGFVADWCCHLAVDRAMLALVLDLARRNRILLFSNTNREHWEHLLGLTGGSLGAVEAYLSHEIGRVKPSLEAFRWVAAEAGIEPARSLFIDDLAENVAAARRAGFAAELFTGQAALERRLAAAALSPGRGDR